MLNFNIPKGKPFFTTVKIIRRGEMFPLDKWFFCHDTFITECDFCHNNNIWYKINTDKAENYRCKRHGFNEGLLLFIQPRR